MAGPSERYGDRTDVHAFRVRRLHWASVAAGSASLAVGRVRVTATVTTEEQEAEVAVLHRGDGAVVCRVRSAPEAGALASVRSDLLREALRSGPAEWAQALTARFAGQPYGVDDVFLDERRRLLAHLAGRSLAVPPSAPGPTVAAGRDFLESLRATGGSIPTALGISASHALGQAARERLAALGAGGAVAPAAEALRDLVARAGRLGLALGLEPEEIAPRLESALERVLGALRASSTAPGVADGLELLGLGTALGAPLDLWASQNAAVRLWREGSPADRAELAPLMTALGFAPDLDEPARERG
jgi:hypothetical protein